LFCRLSRACTFRDLAFCRDFDLSRKVKIELFDLENNGFTPLPALVRMYARDGSDVLVVVGSNLLRRDPVTGASPIAEVCGT